MKEKLRIYLGTFSTNFFSLKFDPESLEIEDLHAIHDPGGRSAYLALDEEKKYLYVANEWMNGDGGLAAFKLVEGGDPVFLNAIYSNGQGPAQVSTMKAYGKTFVLGAGVFEGDVMVCPTAEDGSLLPMSDYFKIVDVDKVAERGKAHGINAIPGTNFVLVPDTLNGQIYTFELTPEGKLEKRFVFDDPAVRCPRHMTFSNDGTKLYFLTERANSLEAFNINRETGELTHFFHGSTLPEDFTGSSMASAIHLSPDGRFVYLSNRGYNSIAVFRVDSDPIERVGLVCDEIESPREFMITPDGEFMFVGNQANTKTIIFRINHETGMPEYTGKSFPLPFEPGPVSFISIPRANG